MKNIWIKTGRVAFWFSFPLLFWLLRFGRRTRVVIECEGKILMTKGWLSDGNWMLPGGGIHRGEDSKVGAVREVFEETGVKILPVDLHYFGTIDYRRKGLRFIYERFWVELSAFEPTRISQKEIVEVAWVPIENLIHDNTRRDAMDTLVAWKALDRS